MGNHIYIAIPVMALLAIIESSVLSRFPILGITPQLMFVVALAWGLERGLEEGLIWAFIGGIVADLFSIAPLGISALGFMAGVGIPLLIRPVLPPRRLLVAMLLTALGTLIYLAVYFVGLRLYGFGIGLGGMVELLPLVVVHVVLIAPAYLLVQALLRAFKPRRVEF